MATELVATALQLHLSKKLGVHPYGVPTSDPLPLFLPMTLVIEKHTPRFVFPEKMDSKPYLKEQDSILMPTPSMTTTIAVGEYPLTGPLLSPNSVPSVVAIAKDEAKLAGFPLALIPAGMGVLLVFGGLYLNRRRIKKNRRLRLDRERLQMASSEHPVPVAKQSAEMPSLPHDGALVPEKTKVGEKTTPVADWLDSIPPYTEKVREEFGRLILKLDTPKTRGSSTLFSKVPPLFRKIRNGIEYRENKVIGLSEPFKPVETIPLPPMHKERLQKKYRKSLLPFSWRKPQYKSSAAKHPINGVAYVKQGKSAVRRTQEEIHNPGLDSMGGEVGIDKESLQKLSEAQRGIALSAYRKTSNNQ